jgi:hypothetical protein
VRSDAQGGGGARRGSSFVALTAATDHQGVDAAAAPVVKPRCSDLKFEEENKCKQ